MAVQVLDVSAGSPLRRHGWPASGPLCGSVARQTLRPKDHLLSADEKTSIQAHRRSHPSLPPAPRRAAYIENEYERGGARQYMAAWDVRRGDVMGQGELTTGIAPFGRLLKKDWRRNPIGLVNCCFGSWTMARRIAVTPRRSGGARSMIGSFWSIHWFTPVGSIKSISDFSIIQCKVLSPSDFADLEAIQPCLALYEELSHQNPHIFSVEVCPCQTDRMVVKDQGPVKERS